MKIQVVWDIIPCGLVKIRVEWFFYRQGVVINEKYIRLLHTEDGVKRCPEASVTIYGVDMTQHHSIRVFLHHHFENLTSRKMVSP